jgi:hypothetical protein
MKSQRDRQFNRRIHKPSESTGFFTQLFSIFPNLIIIAAALGAYYYVTEHNLYSEYNTYMFWGMKILVGFNIIAASARTFIASFLALGAGAGFLVAAKYYHMLIIPMSEAWQIIVVAVVGLVIKLLLDQTT